MEVTALDVGKVQVSFIQIKLIDDSLVKYHLRFTGYNPKYKEFKNYTHYYYHSGSGEVVFSVDIQPGYDYRLVVSSK